MNKLIFANRKQVRAAVIARNYAEGEYNGIVCFSCGNASGALIGIAKKIIANPPDGEWWTPGKIAAYYKGYLDATSGHLTLPVMKDLSDTFRFHLGLLKDDTYEVPTGSGETILCLSWAYPGSRFIAVYNVGKGTEYDERNPLNDIIRSNFEVRM